MPEIYKFFSKKQTVGLPDRPPYFANMNLEAVSGSMLLSSMQLNMLSHSCTTTTATFDNPLRGNLGCHFDLTIRSMPVYTLYKYYLDSQFPLIYIVTLLHYLLEHWSMFDGSHPLCIADFIFCVGSITIVYNHFSKIFSKSNFQV